MDRLKKLLGADPPVSQSKKTSDQSQGRSREAERSALNNADRNFNRQVYQSEIRQANLYDQSQMPPTPTDVGVSFKIGSFVNKLSQLLGFKSEVYQQLQTLITLPAIQNPGQPLKPGRLLSDARLISVSADFFKMVDIIATYNELVNYIQLYAPQMRASSDFANGVNATYLLPLIQLLKQTASVYSQAFQNFPNTITSPADRDAYGKFRKACTESYATCLYMSENLSNAIYSNLTKKEISRYASAKRIEETVFSRNPFPVDPALDPLVQQQAQAPPQQPFVRPGRPGLTPEQVAQAQEQLRLMQEAEALAQQQQQQQQGQPGQQGQPQPQPAPAPQSAKELRAQALLPLLRDYNTAKQQEGIPEADVFNRGRFGASASASALQNDIQRFSRDQQVAQGVARPSIPSIGDIKNALPLIRAEVRGQARPVQPAPAPVQPGSPQQQPLPAPVPPAQPVAQAPSLRAYRNLSDQNPSDDVSTTGQVFFKMYNDDPDTAIPDRTDRQDTRALVNNILAVVKRLEIQRQNVLNPRDAGAVGRVYDEITQDQRIAPDFTRLAGQSEREKKAFIENLLSALRDVRIEFARQEATDAGVPEYAGQEAELWGHGKRNAKQFLRGCGMPPQLMQQVINKHGITDDMTVDDLAGSGVFDTIKDFASSIGDSASGWFNTIKDNLPNMSDLRRATSRIVPDNLSQYLPSGLQRTFGDKAKDFFGFGQRNSLEYRKRLAELERGNPRVVDMSQGRRERENAMPYIMEFNAPAEYLKRRGEVLSGGVYDGLNNHINDVMPYESFTGNVDPDDAEENTPFKRRIGMPNPFSRVHPPIHVRPVLASNALDIDESLIPFSNIFGSMRSGHAKEMEKPVDLDENPDPIRITNENYRIFTGKQKAPKYKILS